MLIDTTPLCQVGPNFTVLAERHEVLFQDGTTVGLHQVLLRGVPNVYLRALVHSGLHAMVFDVRDVASSLAEDLPIAPTRDLRGLVSLTLRHRYSTATELAAAVMGSLLACALLPDDTGSSTRHPIPTLRGQQPRLTRIPNTPRAYA